MAVPAQAATHVKYIGTKKCTIPRTNKVMRAYVIMTDGHSWAGNTRDIFITHLAMWGTGGGSIPTALWRSFDGPPTGGPGEDQFEMEDVTGTATGDTHDYFLEEGPEPDLMITSKNGPKHAAYWAIQFKYGNHSCAVHFDHTDADNY